MMQVEDALRDRVDKFETKVSAVRSKEPTRMMKIAKSKIKLDYNRNYIYKMVFFS